MDRDKSASSLSDVLDYRNTQPIPRGLPPIVRVECLNRENTSYPTPEDLSRASRKRLGLPLSPGLYNSCPDLVRKPSPELTRRASSDGQKNIPREMRQEIPFSAALSTLRSSPLMRRKRNSNIYGTMSSLANNPAKSRMDIPADLIDPTISLPSSPASTPKLWRKLISPVLSSGDFDRAPLKPLSGRCYTVENVSQRQGGVSTADHMFTRDTARLSATKKSLSAREINLNRAESKESLETKLRDLEKQNSRTCNCISHCDHIPDGMTPESFDRCQHWLQQVEKAKVEKSGLELYTVPPVNWQNV